MPSLDDIGPVVLEKTNGVNVLSLFRYYLASEKGVAFHLNRLKSTSPKDPLCQVWLKYIQ